MKFLIVELGDIGQRALNPGGKVLFADIVEHIGGHDREIDAAKIFKVGDVLQTALAEHRHDASRRAVIDDTGDLLCYPHGNVFGSAGY